MSSFLVEEFLEAITAQLDRTQDALRFKALNRPLTYALKDFSLELKVFVEMDAQGKIRFRPAGPNETGASSVQIGFTTITRPMIEENTVSLAATRSPSLADLGLEEGEQHRLEKLGVRNAADLQRFKTGAGDKAAARLAGITVESLRRALQAARPIVKKVTPVPTPPREVRPPEPPAGSRPPVRPPAVREEIPTPGKAPRPPAAPKPPRGDLGSRIRLQPGMKQLRLAGNNLVGESGPPKIRLNNRVLSVQEADEHQVLLDIPAEAESGPLEIELPDGETLTYELSFDADESGKEGNGADPWAPH